MRHHISVRRGFPLPNGQRSWNSLVADGVDVVAAGERDDVAGVAETGVVDADAVVVGAL